jgi:hypothetical protein
MPTTFDPFGPADLAFAQEVVESHHPLLAVARVDYCFAVNHSDWPMKSKGQRVLGKAKIVSLEDRARGGPDAKVTVDKSWWDDRGERERAALLDHELCHFALVPATDKDREKGKATPCGRWKADDLGRPKLKYAHHDAEVGVFFSVIKRHGRDAADARVVAALAGEESVKPVLQQLLFWG